MTFRSPVCALAALAFALSAPLVAQDELSDDREVEEREIRQQTMSEPVYKRLTAIHELMGADENPQAAQREALEKARVLEGNGRLNAYERALVFQTIGFIYANESKVGDAITYFEKSLAENALANEAQQGMLYSLASLYMSEAQYQKAIDTAREWFRYEADPKADAFILIGQAYAQLDDYKSAEPYVLKALEKSEKPQESWHQLLLAVYFETQQLPKTIPLLRKMVQYWPDKRGYWETLSGAHMELNQDRDALSTMMVAYHKGLIDSSERILALVKLNMFLEIPYTAGAILDEQIQAGVVERNKENLELLQSAWTAAQEFDKSLAVMDELGRLTGDPQYAIDQAKIYNELADWENVVRAADTALERNYDKPGEAQILRGIALSELGQLRDAQTAFETAEAVGNAEDRRNARGWLDFVRDRLATAAGD